MTGASQTDGITNAITVALATPDETDRLARALAPLAAPGLVICLWGDVGAGKTAFARHLIQHLQTPHGPPEDVPSPTFTLVQTYPAGPLDILHADLYRLNGPADALELGLAEAFDTALCLIEWPDRLGALVPELALHMNFSVAPGDTRCCGISSGDDALMARIRILCGTTADA